MKKFLLLSAVLAVLLMASPSFANVVTTQRWDFINGTGPDYLDNPYPPDPVLTTDLGYSSTFQWLQDMSGAGSLTTIEIPNSDYEGGWKWIEVTIGYMAQDAVFDISLDTVPDTTTTFSGSINVGSYLGPNQLLMTEQTWRWEIKPNPQFEILSIATQGIFAMDFVEVVTECVPEPATMCLLGLGGLLLRRRKRA